MKRALALYIPFLSTDRLRRSRRALPFSVFRAAGFNPRASRAAGFSLRESSLPDGQRTAFEAEYESENRSGTPFRDHLSRDLKPARCLEISPSRGICKIAQAKACGSATVVGLTSANGTDPCSPSSSAADDEPVVTVSPHGQALHVVHLSRSAYEQGIRPGQTLASARAMVPRLVACDDDPAADRRELEALAVWAGCLSPIVHIEGDDTLIIDVTGCDKLFSGEANLLARAIDGVQDLGFSARGVIADSMGGAWAIAHAHCNPAVIAEPGRTAAELAPLPVWSLRISPETTAALASVGVETIASLLYLPRSSLTSRFGEALLNRMDQALGDLAEPLIPYRPRQVLTSRFRIGVATTRLDVLSEGIRRALERFCGELERKAAGVRQMFVTFYCPDVITGTGSRKRSVTLDVNMSQPTRSVKHLFSLLTAALDRLRLPAPADYVVLWARRIDSLNGWQDELFPTGSQERRELGDLLDRLAVRLGSEAVARAEPIGEHQPELAFRYVSLVGAELTSTKRSSASKADESPGHDTIPAAPRPLRLLPRPVEIAATSLVSEGPPVAFRLNATQHPVVKSVGPERIETGWWRGPHVKRDYYRVTTRTGRRGWVFRERDTDRWFLHGWFD